MSTLTLPTLRAVAPGVFALTTTDGVPWEIVNSTDAHSLYDWYLTSVDNIVPLDKADDPETAITDALTFLGLPATPLAPIVCDGNLDDFSFDTDEDGRTVTVGFCSVCEKHIEAHSEDTAHDFISGEVF